MCNNATNYYFVLWATFRSLEMQSKTRIGYILPNWRCIQIHSSFSLESNSVIFSSHVSLRKCFGPLRYILYMKMLLINITTLYYNDTYIYIFIYPILSRWNHVSFILMIYPLIPFKFHVIPWKDWTLPKCNIKCIKSFNMVSRAQQSHYYSLT